MYQYNIVEWLLCFYFYCFAGWIWESCYVSVKKRKWVNRGFMHGPFLPLYGSGAVTILLLTIPVQENRGLIFLCGLVGATILEYFTGSVMEKLFHVRYWDYSNQKFHLNGHICITSSIAWGFLSVILVTVVQKPVEHFIFAMPAITAQLLAFLLTIYIAVDLTQSFNEAMDLKAILKNLTDNREDDIKKFQKRFDVVTTFFDEDTNSLRKSIEQNFKSKAYIHSLRLLKRNPGATSAKYKKALDEFKHTVMNKR